MGRMKARRVCLSPQPRSTGRGWGVGSASPASWGGEPGEHSGRAWSRRPGDGHIPHSGSTSSRPRPPPALLPPVPPASGSSAPTGRVPRRAGGGRTAQPDSGERGDPRTPPPRTPGRRTRSDCSSSPWHRRLRKDFCSRHSVCRVVRNTVPPTLSRTHLLQPPAASRASILPAGRGVCILPGPAAGGGQVPRAGHAGSCSPRRRGGRGGAAGGGAPSASHLPSPAPPFSALPGSPTHGVSRRGPLVT